jgi:hypothetical protein
VQHANGSSGSNGSSTGCGSGLLTLAQPSPPSATGTFGRRLKVVMDNFFRGDVQKMAKLVSTSPSDLRSLLDDKPVPDAVRDRLLGQLKRHGRLNVHWLTTGEGVWHKTAGNQSQVSAADEARSAAALRGRFRQVYDTVYHADPRLMSQATGIDRDRIALILTGK